MLRSRPSAQLRPVPARAAHPELPPELAVHEPANIAINTAHGAAQSAAINLSNPFLGIDLIRLGGNNLEVALLSALPQLGATLSNITGARWLATRSDPKRAGAVMFLLARLGLLGFAVLNLGVRRGGPISPWRPLVFVVVVALINIPGAVGNLSWQAIIGGLLSAARRARALARRGTVASLTGVVAASIAGYLLRGTVHLSSYAWLFALAALAGVVEVAIFLRLRGQPVIQRWRPDLLPALGRLWGDRHYRAYALSCLPFYLGWVMSWPLFLRYQVSTLHATNLWMGAFSATNALAVALGNPLWARFGERVGARWALPAAIFFLAFVPVTFALRPSLPDLIATNVLGGWGGAGVNLFLLVRLMEVAPPEDRVVAMGTANTLIGLMGVLGPLLGVALLSALTFPGIFWVPAALRLSGGVALAGVALAATRAA